MKFESGFWVLTGAEFEQWVEQYEQIMNDPNSSDELLTLTQEFNDLIAIEG